MKLTRLALAIGLLSTTQVWAVTDFSQALKLEDTVITANREVQKRADSVAAVTVFTRDDINRLQPTNVADLLQRVPGVQVVQSGGRGSATSIHLRGTAHTQTLVLIDGVRAGSASSGGASLQHLNINQIERVEVLRGPRSAIYGADAMGGVIQVFTKRGEQGLTPTVALAVGNKGLIERYLGLAGGNDKTQFNLSTSLDDFSGFDRTRKSWDSDKDHDAYRNKAINFNISHQLTDDLAVGLTALHQEGKTEYDNPSGRWDDATFATYPSSPYDQFAVSSASVFANWRPLENWNTRLELGHAEDRQANYDKLYPAKSAFNTYRDSALWQNQLQLNEQHSLIFGAEYFNDKLRSSTKYDEKSRWNQAAFIQHSYKNEHFSTELGVRGDKNQQFGNYNSWNGALTIPVNDKNELVFSYAEGFRAPTFNDLYWPASPYGAASNPDLAAETSKSYEIQWRSRFTETLSLETAIYRTNIRDAIVLDSSYLPANISRARINGFEASLKHQLLGVQGALAISFLDARDVKTGHQLPHRAKRTLSYDLDKQLGAFGIGATWKLSSNSYDNAANTKPIAGYGTLDLRGSWQTTDELSFDLRLANIFDKGYSRVLYEYPSFSGNNYGYREDRFTIRLGMKWTPNL